MIKFSKKGLTLLDVIFAVGIALVGLLGIVGLLRYVILVGRASADRFVATNLAEEGIEIVRSYRDSMWANPPGGVPYQYISVFGSAIFPYSYAEKQVDYTKNGLDNYSNAFLNIDASGFYSYAAGTQTKFKREIFLDSTKCNVAAVDNGKCISVVSEVKWDNYTLDVEDWLYNWKP